LVIQPFFLALSFPPSLLRALAIAKIAPSLLRALAIAKIGRSA
jgi:hypothetical protein